MNRDGWDVFPVPSTGGSPDHIFRAFIIMLWLKYVLIYAFFYKVHQIKRYPEIRKKLFADRTIELVSLSNVLIGVPAIKNSMARPSLL
jgi:hypothetical protein